MEEILIKFGVYILIAVGVCIIFWLIDSVAVFGLAKAAGYNKAGLTFIPIPMFKSYVLLRSLNTVSPTKATPKSILIWHILMGLLLVQIPFVGIAFAIVGAVASIVMYISMLKHMLYFCRDYGKSFAVVLLLLFFVPYFGRLIVLGGFKKMLLI